MNDNPRPTYSNNNAGKPCLVRHLMRSPVGRAPHDPCESPLFLAWITRRMVKVAR